MKALPDEMRFRSRRRAGWGILAGLACLIAGLSIAFVRWHSSEITHIPLEKIRYELVIGGLGVAVGMAVAMLGVAVLGFSLCVYLGKLPPGTRLRQPGGPAGS
jgi:hypothetical protein